MIMLIFRLNYKVHYFNNIINGTAQHCDDTRFESRKKIKSTKWSQETDDIFLAVSLRTVVAVGLPNPLKL